MYFVGIGKDIHKIKRTNAKVVLGGFVFDSKYKIVAISDGDLVLHSIADAILGASQNGDIGIYFPETCIRNKGIDSKKILQKAISLAHSKGFTLNNIDITIICDKILISPIRDKIKQCLIRLLNNKHINVKATRFEQNKSLIQCDAIVSLKRRK